MIKMEIWKDIENYKDKYQISNMGNVKSLKYLGHKKEKIMVPNKISNGYLQIALLKNNERKMKLVHRLVIETFVGNSDLQCNHINGIKTDNRIENIEYCTQSENAKHSFKIGLQNNKGESHPSNKLREDDVKLIRKLVEKFDIKQKTVAYLFGVSKYCISDIIRGKTWNHV